MAAGAARTIGVLALQGGFAAHAAALTDAGLAPRLVRAAAEIAGLDGLVLPGGESTTQLILLHRHGLAVALRALVAAGAPVLATCAGLILAAARVERPEQPGFGFLDVTVERNAWGRQLDSFETAADDGVMPLVFIRAPRIRRTGPAVAVLATHRGEAVLVRQGRVFGATFHPELAADRGPARALLREIFGSPA
jgi:5'-phosphate synthase pdxT subunit